MVEAVDTVFSNVDYDWLCQDIGKRVACVAIYNV